MTQNLILENPYTELHLNLPINDDQHFEQPKTSSVSYYNTNYPYMITGSNSERMKLD